MFRKSLIIILITFFSISGLFYFIFLKPVSSLLTAKRELTSHYLNLKQNRLSITSLTKLDPNMKDFSLTKDRILISIANTNEHGLNALKQNPISPNTINIILKYTDIDVSAFQQRVTEIYDNQQATLTELKNYNAIVGKLYRYDFVKDLSTEELSKNQMLTRINATREGLSKIKTEISTLEDSDNLESVISSTQNDLENFSAFLNNTNNNNISLLSNEAYIEYIGQIMQDFSELREQSFRLELAIITSENTVNFLVNQTNLLLEYEYLFDSIDYYVKKKFPILGIRL